MMHGVGFFAMIAGALAAVWGGLKHSAPIQHNPSKTHSYPDVSQTAYVHDDEGQSARFAANGLSAAFGIRGAAGWGGYVPYTSAASIGKWKETKDTGTIAYAIGTATAPSGLKFLHTAAANDKLTVVSAEAWPLLQRTSANRAYMKAKALLTLSAVTTVGWQLGFATAGGTELWTGDAADEILLIKAQAANTFSLRVVQNGVAAVVGVVTPQTAAVALTPDEWTLRFEVGTLADGTDTILEVWQNGTDLVKAGNVTNVLALKVALYTMFLTTPPILQAMFSTRVNDAAARNAIAPGLWCEVD